MASLNQVVIVGHLTRDPQLKTIPSGMSVAELGLAVNEKYTTKDGEKKETVVFVDCIAWEKTAENCVQYLHKGSPVLIVGKLQLDQWESKEGEKRSKLRVRVSNVQFLGGKSDGATEHHAIAPVAPAAHGEEDEGPDPF
jgi:single-strand DNA-binding protein